MKIVQFFIALWLAWLPIAIIFYMFSNNSIDELKNARIEDIIRISEITKITQDQRISAMKSSSTDTEMLDKMFSYTISNLKKEGYRPDASIQDIIDNIEGVYFLDSRIVNSVKLKDAVVNNIEIRFSTTKATYVIRGMATDKTFINPLSAKLITIDPLAIEINSDNNSNSTKSFSLSQAESIRIMLELSKEKMGSIENYIPESARIMINSN